MEFKGTKGKWELFNNEYFHEVIIKEPNLKIVCAVNSNLKEVKHNALLMSKAPEMLEILKRIMKTYDKGTQTYLDCQQLIKQATTL